MMVWATGRTCAAHQLSYDHSNVVKPVLSDHVWAKKKWPLNRGGLLMEVEMYGILLGGL
jgi:hypothetical protein